MWLVSCCESSCENFYFLQVYTRDLLFEDKEFETV